VLRRTPCDSDLGCTCALTLLCPRVNAALPMQDHDLLMQPGHTPSLTPLPVPQNSNSRLEWGFSDTEPRPAGLAIGCSSPSAIWRGFRVSKCNICGCVITVRYYHGPSMASCWEISQCFSLAVLRRPLVIAKQNTNTTVYSRAYSNST
jgi:hypothetical protein